MDCSTLVVVLRRCNALVLDLMRLKYMSRGLEARCYIGAEDTLFQYIGSGEKPESGFVDMISRRR